MTSRGDLSSHSGWCRVQPVGAELTGAQVLAFLGGKEAPVAEELLS